MMRHTVDTSAPATSAPDTSAPATSAPATPASVRTYLGAVDAALRATFSDLAVRLPATLLQIGKEALATPGKVMAEASFHSAVQIFGDADATELPLPRWPLYVILSYQAALPAEERETWERAIPAATAIEIAIAATDILDELADGDPSSIIKQYGPGQAMNTANLMLVVAQQTLLNSGTGEGGERALRALHAMLDIGLQAGIGQHLDMLYGGMGPQEVDLDMSAHVASLKAGALIGGACRMGALMAGAEGTVLETLTRFGREMGGMAQLINDIQDVLPHSIDAEAMATHPMRKTDLLLRKRTLPIVYTLRDDATEPNALQSAFSNPQETPVDEERLRRAILGAGGVQFAQLVIEVHRQNAIQAIEELDVLRPGAREVLAPLFSADDAVLDTEVPN